MAKYETPWQICQGSRPNKARQQIFSKSGEYVCEAITLPVAERIVRALNRDELFDELAGFVTDVANVDFAGYPVHIKHGIGDEAKALRDKIDALKGGG